MSDYFFDFGGAYSSPVLDLPGDLNHSADSTAEIQLADPDLFKPEQSDEDDAFTEAETKNVYHVDDKLVAEYFDAGGYFVGATYSYDSGGGSWFTADGRSGAWSGSTGYWSIGGSLLIGFGLWGTGNGDWGIAWNAGIGAYALAGNADSVGAAIQHVTEDRIDIAFDINGLIDSVSINPQTGHITFDDIGFNLGLYASDPEAGTGPDPKVPYTDDEPLHSLLIEV
jgi:hypothetical protein